MAEAVGHPWMGNSLSDLKQDMLAEIGVPNIAALFEQIPQDHRLKMPLKLPDGIKAESQLRRLHRQDSWNLFWRAGPLVEAADSVIGAGSAFQIGRNLGRVRRSRDPSLAKRIKPLIGLRSGYPDRSGKSRFAEPGLSPFRDPRFTFYLYPNCRWAIIVSLGARRLALGRIS